MYGSGLEDFKCVLRIGAEFSPLSGRPTTANMITFGQNVGIIMTYTWACEVICVDELLLL